MYLGYEAHLSGFLLDLNDEATTEGMSAIRYFAYRLHEAQINPCLEDAMQAQLEINNLIPHDQEERTRALEQQGSPARCGRNSTQEGKKSPTQKRRPSANFSSHESIMVMILTSHITTFGCSWW